MRGTHGDEDRMGHEEVLDLDLDKSGAETEDFSPHLTEYLLPVYWKVSHTFHGVWTLDKRFEFETAEIFTRVWPVSA